MKKEFKKYWLNEPKNAIVTGASSGMGLCYAKKLAEQGYNLVLISNQEHEMQQITSLLQEQYTTQNIQCLVINLAQENAAEQVFEYTQKNNFKTSLLINNAGIFQFKDILDTSMQTIETFIGLHVLTTTKLCRIYGKEMKENCGGRIINISSISAHTPFCGIALYSSTKSYLLNFTKAFALEMVENNVKVSAVCPGAVATDLYKLSGKLQKIGIITGIIMPPNKLVKRVLAANKKGRIVIIPGIGNRLFKPLFAILPSWLKLIIRKRIKRSSNKTN